MGLTRQFCEGSSHCNDGGGTSSFLLNSPLDLHNLHFSTCSSSRRHSFEPIKETPVCVLGLCRYAAGWECRECRVGREQQGFPLVSPAAASALRCCTCTLVSRAALAQCTMCTAHLSHLHSSCSAFSLYVLTPS